MASRSQFFRRFIESLMIRPKDAPNVVRFRFNEAQELLQEGWAEHESWLAAGRPETPRPQRRGIVGN